MTEPTTARERSDRAIASIPPEQLPTDAAYTLLCWAAMLEHTSPTTDPESGWAVEVTPVSPRETCLEITTNDGRWMFARAGDGSNGRPPAEVFRVVEGDEFAELFPIGQAEALTVLRWLTAIASRELYSFFKTELGGDVRELAKRWP